MNLFSLQLEVDVFWVENIITPSLYNIKQYKFLWRQKKAWEVPIWSIGLANVKDIPIQEVLINFARIRDMEESISPIWR